MYNNLIKKINYLFNNNIYKNIINFFFIYKFNFKQFIIVLIVFISFHEKNILNNDLIRIAYYCRSLKYGGVERVISLLINFLSKDKRFKHILITKNGRANREYSIPENTKRICLSENRISFFETIIINNIDILIYNFYEQWEIKELNKLKNVKIIYYDHSSYFYWIYLNIYKFKNTVYQSYKNCRYVISLIQLENDYLFKKWGISSILMDNPSTFEYDSVVPSDLSKKNIIMIGRYDPIKRFDLGIKAMKSIIKEIPDCQLKIVSSHNKKFNILIKNLKLENYISIVGLRGNIEIYLKNSSLHIFPSLSEAYPMVLSEAKIFGIPSIICGLDYLTLAKGGNIIIYDDNPEIIAKEAIKILNNDLLRKKLGKEARKSMKMHKNSLITKKWIKLILSIYKGKEASKIKISKKYHRITEKEAEKILNNQLKLLRKRKLLFRNLTLQKLRDFSFN